MSEPVTRTITFNGNNVKKRQRTLGRVVREELDDGKALVDLWVAIAMDPARTVSERLRASELLADRGWGKAANFVAQEGDPLGLEDLEAGAEDFQRRVLRLVESRGSAEDPPGGSPGAGGEPGAAPELPPLALGDLGEA